MALVKQHDLRGIIALVHHGSMLEQVCAAGELKTIIFKSGDMKEAVVQQGGIPPLIALLKTGATEGKTNAAGALCYITGNIANRTLVVQGGGIPPLVELLKTGSAEGKTHAACTLS
jgi:hypothetical protein